MARKFNFDFSKGGKTPAKTFAIGGLALLSAIYILNPTAGFFELIPDNIPFLGNVDEFTAAMIFLNCLKYFDIDLLGLFTGSKPEAKDNAEPVYQPPARHN